MNGGRATGTVLFDLDGTLADTLPDLGDALAEALAELKLAPIADERLRPMVSRGARAMAVEACGASVDEATLERVLARFLALYGANVSRRTRLTEGMPAVLDALDARAIAWGVVTNKRREFTEPLMSALDPGARAACIVSGDSTANSKPHPQPLLHACRLAGSLPGECVYVGDARIDVLAAHRAGMRCLVARYGYIPPGEDPAGWGGDGIIDAPGDLLIWLDSQ